MNSTKQYRVNKPNVVHEVLEGEAVIVNLDNGSYYSTEQAGATIWSLLTHGATVPEIVAALHRHHSNIPTNVEEVVTQWMHFLESESLVVSDSFIDGGTNGERSNHVATEVEHKTVFMDPKLEKYTDMEDLLLLDPIHDVQEVGWPQTSGEKAG
jgi:Coenzyme PQQ synthesis protein D (PqqD)